MLLCNAARNIVKGNMGNERLILTAYKYFFLLLTHYSIISSGAKILRMVNIDTWYFAVSDFLITYATSFQSTRSGYK